MKEPFTFRNTFEQDSLCIPAGNKLNLAPEEFRALVPKQYIECYLDSQGVISKIAHECQISSLQAWLFEVSRNPIALVLHHAEVVPGTWQSDVSLLGYLATSNRRVNFRLPDQSHYQTGIEIIDALFSSINGTIDAMDAWLSSGWVKSNSIRVELFCETDLFPVDSPNVFQLYCCSTGDQLLYFEEQMYANMHGDVSLVGDAKQVISDYFAAELNGTEWDPFPY
ncbi:hypothetical protein N9153_02915 [Planctomicrobium sp.]|jgi:hypothetical protein|nr:hypothetical protein [Planctomicrobium sp.]MDB4439856.1 hypothetical protein [Planctomicrobium sp.]